MNAIPHAEEVHQPSPSNQPDDAVGLDSPSTIGRAVRALAYDRDESVIFLDPPECFDDALIGLTDGHFEPVRAVYDSEKCITQMMDHNDWDYEEASEFFSYNTAGTSMQGWPVFMTVPKLTLLDAGNLDALPGDDDDFGLGQPNQ